MSAIGKFIPKSGAECRFYAYEMTSDDLLVGYGLPWEHKYRNIPYVSRLKR